MMADLTRLQSRLDEYELELAKIIREFGDELSMTYFSDRFGYDHPLSARADQGVRLQQQLKKMKKELQTFVATFTEAYPTLKS